MAGAPAWLALQLGAVAVVSATLPQCTSDVVQFVDLFENGWHCDDISVKCIIMIQGPILIIVTLITIAMVAIVVTALFNITIAIILSSITIIPVPQRTWETNGEVEKWLAPELCAAAFGIALAGRHRSRRHHCLQRRVEKVELAMAGQPDETYRSLILEEPHPCLQFFDGEDWCAAAFGIALAGRHRSRRHHCLQRRVEKVELAMAGQPDETYRSLILEAAQGKEICARSIAKLRAPTAFGAAAHGGACIGLAFLLTLLVAGMKSGGQLFTNNAALLSLGLFSGEVSLSAFLRNWITTYLGNMLGMGAAMAVAASTGLLTATPLQVVTSLATQSKLRGEMETMCSAGFCTLLVFLASWTATVARKETKGRLMGLWFCASFYLAVGFERVVTDVFFLPPILFCNGSFGLSDVLMQSWLPVSFGTAAAFSLLVLASKCFRTVRQKDLEVVILSRRLLGEAFEELQRDAEEQTADGKKRGVKGPLPVAIDPRKEHDEDDDDEGDDEDDDEDDDDDDDDADDDDDDDDGDDDDDDDDDFETPRTSLLAAASEAQTYLPIGPGVGVLSRPVEAAIARSAFAISFLSFSGSLSFLVSTFHTAHIHRLATALPLSGL
ncbi:putative formate transporter [Symbiodinium microadriaticum]|uniref:Putative formate transporter n=1 Tax=Symbiodinium microadriaticum TaxID=2951 RepID=A0A1Q9DG22_SYMMI|nr:putative formate transporter [Symbiodinium microadriaticum]